MRTLDVERIISKHGRLKAQAIVASRLEEEGWSENVARGIAEGRVEKAWREARDDEKRTDNLVAINEEGERRYGDEARAVLGEDDGDASIVNELPDMAINTQNQVTGWLRDRHPDDAVDLVTNGFLTWDIEGSDAPQLSPFWGYAKHIVGDGEGEEPTGINASYPDTARQHPVHGVLEDFTELSREWLAEHHGNGDGTISLYRSTKGGHGEREGKALAMQSWTYDQDVARQLADKYDGEVMEDTVSLDRVVFAPDLLWPGSHYAEATIVPEGNAEKSHLHELPSGELLLKQGEYCDVPGHCFDSPAALGGHVASTGHEVEAEEVEVSEEAHTRTPVDVSIEETLEYGDALNEAVDWEAARESSEKFDKEFGFEKFAERHLGEAFEKNGIDNPAPPFNQFYVGARTNEVPQRMEEQLPEATKAVDGWGTDADQPSSLPLWAWAAEEAENSFVHPRFAHLKQRWEKEIEEEEDEEERHWIEQRMNAVEVSQEEAEQADFMARMTQEAVRQVDPTYDPETDTVKVYRGVGGELGEKLLDAKEEEEVEDIQVRHRALESWTANPEVAESFGQAVLSARVKVDNIATSWMTGPGLFAEEAEYAVANPDVAVYSTEDVFVSEDAGIDVPVWFDPDDPMEPGLESENWNAWVSENVPEWKQNAAREISNLREEIHQEFREDMERYQNLSRPSAERLEEEKREAKQAWQEAVDDFRD